MGPIGVKKHLAPYLPSHPVVCHKSIVSILIIVHLCSLNVISYLCKAKVSIAI